MRYVKIDKILPGMVLGLNIYDLLGQIVLKKGTILADKYISSLRFEGYQGVYIDDTLSSMIEIEDDFDSFRYSIGSDTSNVKELCRVAVDIVDDIIRKHPERLSIQKTQSYNDYLFCRGVNTAIYSVMIGKDLGLDREGLYLLSKAAILHDIGMAKISPSIRNKKGSLIDNEYNEVKNHVKHAEEMLKKYGLNNVIMKAILHHHENENGSGYPFKYSGKQISDFAKIIHVADVLDAMTTKRPYKDDYIPADVLDYLSSGKGILFHSAIVGSAIKCFDAYPIGSEIVLSNGKRAIVSGRSSDNFRPKVLLVESGKIVNLATDPEYKYVAVKSNSFGTESKAEEEEDTTKPSLASQRVSRKKTIMIVDDTYIARRTVEEALGKEFNIISLDNGFDAVVCVKDKKKQIDLIIMDIEMPEMNGITAVERIREAGFTNIPVIFLTSVNSREMVLRCINAGAIDYLLKPTKQIYVYERVQEALRNM